MIGSLLLFLAAARPLTPDAKISLLVRARPCREVIQQIAESSGLILKVDQKFQNEPLIVAVKDAPVELILKHIGKVVGGEWVQDAKGIRYLELPPKLQRQQEQEEQAYKVSSMKGTLGPISEWLKSLPPIEGRYALTITGKVGAAPGSPVISFVGNTPYGRLGYRLLLSLGEETLAKISPGERIVFSNQPNQAQKSFPSDVSGPLAQFKADCSAYCEAWSNSDRSPTSSPLWYSLDQAKTNGIGKVTLALGRVSIGDAFGMEVAVWDAKGKCLAHRNQNEWSLNADPKAPPRIAPKVPLAIPLSKLSEEFFRFRGAMLNDPLSTPPQEIADALLNPEKFDPLSLTVTDALLAIAEFRQEQLIATVDDVALGETINLRSRDQSLSGQKFNDWLEKCCVVDESDGWMRTWPKLRVESRTLRVNRSQLGSFLRAAYRSPLTLDQLGSYYCSIPNRYLRSFEAFHAILMPRIMEGVNPDTIDAFRLYGQLAPRQREAILGGDSAEFSALSPGANQCLYRMAFGEKARSGVMDIVSFDYDILPPDPTEIMPMGLPKKGILRLRRRAGPVVRVYPSPGTQNPVALLLDADELGAFLAAAEKGRENASMAQRFLYGETSGVSMEMLFAPQLTRQTVIQSTRYVDKPVSFDALPQEFREQVLIAKRQALEGKSSP